MDRSPGKRAGTGTGQRGLNYYRAGLIVKGADMARTTGLLEVATTTTQGVVVSGALGTTTWLARFPLASVLPAETMV